MKVYWFHFSILAVFLIVTVLVNEIQLSSILFGLLIVMSGLGCALEEIRDKIEEQQKPDTSQTSK